MDSDSNKNKNDRRGLKSWLIAALFAWFSVGALVSAAAQSVTLNFKDAELDAVIGWVSEQTDKNFVVDPRVKSKVTIVSGKQHNKDEIYQVFLSVLQVHGFAAVPAGDIIKIMPDVNAKQSGVPVAGTRGTQRGDEMVTRVIPLDNVPEAQQVPNLRRQNPQQGQGFTIQADESTYALVITAPMEVFRPLQAVIRQLDVRRAQVVVEAIIAEISKNKAAQLGVQWAVDAIPPGVGGGNGPIGFANFQSGSGS